MPRPRILNLLLGVLAALFSVAVLVVLGVFAGSEWLLRRRHAVPLAPFSSDAAVADSVEGRRLAILVGCLEGCHGPQGQGGDVGAPGVFLASAPPFSQVLPRYTDPELARLVRFGVKRDGVSAMGMPSETFYPLADADLAMIAAHLRRRPEYAPVARKRSIGPVGRVALVLRKWNLSADGVDRSIPRWGEQPMPTVYERGRYLASVTCTECHGLDLKGESYMASPPLSITGGYTLAQFDHLMRTGQPISGRDLGIMSRTAKVAFSHFTADEVSGLHEFLSTLGDTSRTR